MTDPAPSPRSADDPEDRALPFQVEALEVRGRVATLGSALTTILDRHAYPEPVSRMLGEAVVLASLLATSLKDVGRFILQTATDGPVSMLVVDIRMAGRDAVGEIRATASFDAPRIAALGSRPIPAASLIGTGTLAMTVEQGSTHQRYQGFVELEGTLEDAAHRYFEQSEQIPTKVRLAVAEMFERGNDGSNRRRWRAGGIIAQFLPHSVDRLRQRDLPPGDRPSGTIAVAETPDDNAWVEAVALLDTVSDDELTDPAITAERLLFRLFHERGVRVFEPHALAERCTCSPARIEGVLSQMSDTEIAEAAIDGEITVKCEFCGLVYRFEAARFLDKAAGA